MSDVISAAVAALNDRTGGSFDGSAKFVIPEEGTIVLDEAGAREADEDTEVTMTADADTFRSILEGETNATAAFMSGKLKVDGDMGMAMKLGAALG